MRGCSQHRCGVAENVAVASRRPRRIADRSSRNTLGPRTAKVWNMLWWETDGPTSSPIWAGKCTTSAKTPSKLRTSGVAPSTRRRCGCATPRSWWEQNTGWQTNKTPRTHPSSRLQKEHKRRKAITGEEKELEEASEEFKLLQHEEENPFSFPNDFDNAPITAAQAPGLGQGEPAPKCSCVVPQPLPAGEAGGHILYRTSSLFWCFVCGRLPKRTLKVALNCPGKGQLAAAPAERRGDCTIMKIISS